MSASRFKQLGIYVKKNFRLFLNERGWKSLIFAAIISLLVALVLSTKVFARDQATWTGTFTLVSACIWIGLFNSIQAICKERAVIKNEHFSGMHISSYVFARIIYDAVICFAEAIIMLAVSLIVLSIRIENFGFRGDPLLIHQGVELFVTFFFALFAADLLGLAISAIVKTPAVAMTVMPFVLIVQLIFCGALFTLPKGVDAISAITISKWGLDAMCTTSNYEELESTEKIETAKKLKDIRDDKSKNKDYDNNEYGIPVTAALEGLSDDQIKEFVDANIEVKVKDEWKHTHGNLLLPWAILILHCVVYATVAVVALEFVDKDHR